MFGFGCLNKHMHNEMYFMYYYCRWPLQNRGHHRVGQCDRSRLLWRASQQERRWLVGLATWRKAHSAGPLQEEVELAFRIFEKKLIAHWLKLNKLKCARCTSRTKQMEQYMRNIFIIIIIICECVYWRVNQNTHTIDRTDRWMLWICTCKFLIVFV